ncbi:hypothetical protein EV142_11416 [Flavobacterium circumlabens]|uniref:Uncharacterized protein n=1 Tax=Flavobacterium circumlabens TaxID=2133765 RepID=A0ABY2ARV9_9FLAO|nr:hypothetical protein EV142_11416 [Flavobacterium circumlabens]
MKTNISFKTDMGISKILYKTLLNRFLIFALLCLSAQTTLRAQ